MKLYIIALSLIAITVSACMESKADTSPQSTRITAPEKEKVIDREYINHLYGPENDPLKNWTDEVKRQIDMKNGRGC